jgi:dTDP-4-amino-4,6-dideoxygalactose transaminase
MTPSPILLSPPHLGDDELLHVKAAFNTNWVAPVGPHVDAFEAEFAAAVKSPHAVAVSSGTAALHLALRLVGVRAGDEVFCSTLTFVATANPILYQGATPVFIDSDYATWNMDPNALETALEQRARRGCLPKAVIVVHLYGQSADMDPIVALCNRYGVPLIEDAAESLGATYQGRPTGTFGRAGIFSFNGNKIITTSGGGMLVTADAALAQQAKFLATQARDPAPHYQHSHLGYNYRLSNVLAGIGRGQLAVLEERVAARRRNFAAYHQALGHLPGLDFMPEASYGTATRWLTCLTVDPNRFGCDREQIRQALAAAQIESRPVWKPLHLQPLFATCDVVGGTVATDLFQRGLCLPSGSALTAAELARVIDVVAGQYRPALRAAVGVDTKPGRRGLGYRKAS